MLTTDMYRAIPNLLTVLRFVLAIALFVLLALAPAAKGHARYPLIMDGALITFMVAAFTDWLDGFLARRWDAVSDFGRVADPFVDKIVVCGTFVLLTAFEPVIFPAWAVVVVLAREFLVTGLRSLIEQRDVPFGANNWGKLKMVVQSGGAMWLLLHMGHLEDIAWATTLSAIVVWVVVSVTAISAIAYLIAARKLLNV